jgi:hypothetical protein
LESIFKKPLLSVPSRLQRLLLAFEKHGITVSYKPGKKDVSSRSLELFISQRDEENPRFKSSSE